MGGRGGSSKAGGGNRGISADERSRIANNVKSHSKEDNDRAERNYLKSITRLKSQIDNLPTYLKTGYIKSKNDPWFQQKLSDHDVLTRRYEYFKNQRKKYGR